MPETNTGRAKRATAVTLPSAKGKVASPAKIPAKIPAKPAKPGAPTTFNQHTANVICMMISEGKSLRQILREDTTGLLPAQSTVYEWLIRQPTFTEQYARAREEQADTLADEIIAIADEQPEIIVVTDKRTGAVIEHKLDGAFLQWQKNRIDARKWTAMKLKPKKYGDRLGVEGVEGGAPIKTEETSSGRLFEVIRNLEMTKRSGG